MENMTELQTPVQLQTPVLNDFHARLQLINIHYVTIIQPVTEKLERDRKALTTILEQKAVTCLDSDPIQFKVRPEYLDAKNEIEALHTMLKNTNVTNAQQYEAFIRRYKSDNAPYINLEALGTLPFSSFSVVSAYNTYVTSLITMQRYENAMATLNELDSNLSSLDTTLTTHQKSDNFFKEEYKTPDEAYEDFKYSKTIELFTLFNKQDVAFFTPQMVAILPAACIQFQDYTLEEIHKMDSRDILYYYPIPTLLAIFSASLTPTIALSACLMHNAPEFGIAMLSITLAVMVILATMSLTVYKSQPIVNTMMKMIDRNKIQQSVELQKKYGADFLAENNVTATFNTIQPGLAEQIVGSSYKDIGQLRSMVHNYNNIPLSTDRKPLTSFQKKHLSTGCFSFFESKVIKQTKEAFNQTITQRLQDLPPHTATPYSVT